MTKSKYAAMLVMFLEKERIDAKLVRKVADSLRKRGHLFSDVQAAFDGKANNEWLAKKLDQAIQGDGWGLEVYWEPVKDGVGDSNASSVQYVFNTQNPDQLAVDGLACFRVYTIVERMPQIGSKNAYTMVETFKDIVKAVRPRFALLDSHHDVIAKRKGKDPRRFAWGAAYYDSAHVEAIGLDKLRNCAAIIKDEWPDDESFWLQTWDWPFVVAPQLTDQIAKELGLKTVKLPDSKSGTTMRKTPAGKAV